jgi:transposase
MSSHDSAYLCVLIDNEHRYPFDLLRSRSKHNLNRHFEAYPKSARDKVKFVTIDMWQPYKDVALRQFKNCLIAVDPFHVVKQLCDSFSKVRINIMNQVPYGSDAYYLLKNWNFLLEKKNLNLDNEPRYNNRFRRKLSFRQIQNMIFEISDKLLDAYNLKSIYLHFNDSATSDTCEAWLDSLITKFQSYNISEYQTFVSILINWRSEIINSFLRPYGDRKLSNALAENINGKLRAYITISNGFHNFIRFRKRVLLALNPKIFYSISGNISSDKIPRLSNKKTEF